jgi:PST family polysaccharide transporter
MATQLLVYASSSIPNIIVGARYGSTTVGFYSRASQLITFPMNQLFTPITNVALPVLARSQDDRRQFDRHLLRSQIVLSYAVVGVLSLAIVWADPIIPLVFGNQWTPSAPIFQILAVAGAFQAISYVAYWVFLARGLTPSHFRYSVISRSILIAFVLAGSIFGVTGVAVSYVLGVAIGWPLSLLWLRRREVAPVGLMFWTGLRVILVGVLVTAAGLEAAALDKSYSNWLQLVISGLAVLFALAIVVLLVPPIRRDAEVVAATVRHLRPRSRQF